MQKISNTSITMTKGDTLKATVTISQSNGSTYVPEDGDVVRFAMKQYYTDNNPLVYKEIPHDSMLLQLDSEDTKSLNAGKYVYDIQLTYANGDVDTFIDRASITLTEEVD